MDITKVSIVLLLVQFLKRQKNSLKNANVRIFRQLPAKMSPESLDISGLWEDTVEMKSTRLRELTHDCLDFSCQFSCRRNEEYPIKGIDTTFCHRLVYMLVIVEMKSTRLRELTPHINSSTK